MGPVLSLILCSRNDQYMGNSRWRLETTLNYVGDLIEALGRGEDVEVLVTDWGSEVPLRETVTLGPAAARLVSFVWVPPALAKTLQRDSPFPEVLALNAAARRARGEYIGRIDQDTLVGERFLRWFFDAFESQRPVGDPEVPLATALLFANRRRIPYRFAVRSPSLRNVMRFVRLFGTRLPIWRENPATGDVFWSSAVGIWLASRNLWYECGGYDERLIYYNWMETDMICRLRQKYPIVDLGELNGHAFYHLEHYHPWTAWFFRAHEAKNPVVDVTKPPGVLHPNTEAWGLRDYSVMRELSASVPSVGASAALDRTWSELILFALLMLRLAADAVSDRVVVFWLVQYRVWSRRLRRLGQELAHGHLVSWPREVWRLWSSRQTRL